MPKARVNLDGIDAIVFDLGNTLVPFGAREIKLLYAELEEAFAVELGPQQEFFERATRTYRAMQREREGGECRELTVEEFVDAMSDGRATNTLYERANKTMSDTMVSICRIPEGVKGHIERLAKNYKLAVLSNYVLTDPIERVVRGLGAWEFFETIEVSATNGFMKPHGSLFDSVSAKLGAPRDKTLMIGDNIWADVVGGHRAGFKTALTHEHFEGPIYDERAPGVSPDFILKSLDELG